jgi:RloB-like protein
VVKIVTRERDPRGVVDYARKFRDQAVDDYDQVWCVLDVDDFDFGEALAAAHRNDINLAISNPCFELWLLLHHVDVTVALQGASNSLLRLKRIVPEYDKSDLRFEDFAEGIPDAVQRARLLSDDDAPLGPYPSTGMWRLVSLIR